MPRALGLAAARAAVRALAARGEPPLPPPAVRESRAFRELVRAADPADGTNVARAALARERDRLLALVPPEARVAMPPHAVAPHPGVASFVADVVRYVEREPEALVRRLARSPFSGMPRSDAAALAVAAADRSGYLETLRRGAVPMGAVASAAAHAFADGLAACVQAFRAQGATARELVDTIALRFGSDARGERAAAAVDAARDEAAALDAVARAGGATWSPVELAEAIAARAEHDLAMYPTSPAEETALVPFAPLAPEPAHDVKRRRGRFSASALGTYASCERRWYYRYVCAAVDDPGSSASFYGSAFHWALERFHETVTRADAMPPAALEAALDAHIVAAFQRFRTVFETPIEFELQVRRARRTAKRYVAWFVERSRVAPFEVVGTESEAKLQMDGYDFIGYIDRLDRDDRTGGITVVDYKTGKIAQSAREYREGVSHFVDFQLPFYYWARTAAGERVTRLALIPLKEATLDVRPVELEVVPSNAPLGRFDEPRGTIGIDELTVARAKMVEHARRLTDEVVEHFGVTRDPENCSYCPYLNACRERPLAAAERFGR